MAGTMVRIVWVGAAFLLSSWALAEEAPQPELLPFPRQLLSEDSPPIEGPFPVPAYFRTSRYDIWQLHGVDRRGSFRPLVIYSPYGAYYLYNGHPYPWATTHPLHFMSTIVD